MKKSILIVIILLELICAYAQNKHLSILGGIGYSSENERVLGASNLDLVYTLETAEIPITRDIKPFVSIGWRVHNTFSEASDYGHVSIGLETKYIALSGGLLLGNNQQKEDIHILQTGEIKVIKVGAPTSNFTGQQFAIRLNYPISETFSLLGQTTFINGKTMYRAVQFYNIGVRIYIC